MIKLDWLLINSEAMLFIGGKGFKIREHYKVKIRLELVKNEKRDIERVCTSFVS